MSKIGETDEPADVVSARELLSHAEAAGHRARGRRGGTAVPLTVFAVLLVVAGAARLAVGATSTRPPSGLTSGWRWAFSQVLDLYFWQYLGALGLVLTGVLLSVHARRVGAGTRAGGWLAFALGAVVFFSLTGATSSACFEYADRSSCSPLITWLAQAHLAVRSSYAAPVIAVALLLLAWRRHDHTLAGCAVLFGLIAGLTSGGFFDRSAQGLARWLGMDSSTPALSWDGLAYLLLGLVFMVIAVRLTRSERASRR